MKGSDDRPALMLAEALLRHLEAEGVVSSGDVEMIYDAALRSACEDRAALAPPSCGSAIRLHRLLREAVIS